MMAFISPDKGKETLSSSPSDAARDQLPWVEKYRPSDLDHVLAQPDIMNTSTQIECLMCLVKKFIEQGRLPHLLLYGPPGTGKTTTANAVCCALYGAKWRSQGSVLELNASDERGIDVVRDQIKTFAETRGLQSNTMGTFKIVILDEADAMTSAAQNALRRVMEKHVRHVRFIILCNYASQIIPALQSRCTKFRFSPLQDGDLELRLKQVADQEQVQLTPEANQAIVRLARGDMRKVMNVLQACAAANSNPTMAIGEDLVYAVTATAHPRDLDAAFTILLQESSIRMAVLKTEKILQDNAMALSDLVTALFDRLCVYEIPKEIRGPLLKAMADCEHRVSAGVNVHESIQLRALVGAFFQARLQA